MLFLSQTAASLSTLSPCAPIRSGSVRNDRSFTIAVHGVRRLCSRPHSWAAPRESSIQRCFSREAIEGNDFRMRGVAERAGPRTRVKVAAHVPQTCIARGGTLGRPVALRSRLVLLRGSSSRRCDKIHATLLRRAFVRNRQRQRRPWPGRAEARRVMAGRQGQAGLVADDRETSCRRPPPDGLPGVTT